jgi:hypothetical protein
MRRAQVGSDGTETAFVGVQVCLPARGLMHVFACVRACIRARVRVCACLRVLPEGNFQLPGLAFQLPAAQSADIAANRDKATDLTAAPPALEDVVAPGK